MGTITYDSLVTRAGYQLQDTGNTAWTTTELGIWLNDAQRAVVLLRPEASVTNAAVVLVAGAKQSIPSTGHRLIDIVRNMGIDGTTPGAIIRRIDKAVLNDINPSWPTDTAAATVQQFMYDDRDPKNFYVYPAQPSSGFGYVEMIYSVPPTDTSTGNAINIDDIYANAMLNYMMYRAFAKDSEDANPRLANDYYTAFLKELGLGIQTDKQIESPEKS